MYEFDFQLKIVVEVYFNRCFFVNLRRTGFRLYPFYPELSVRFFKVNYVQICRMYFSMRGISLSLSGGVKSGDLLKAI
jgi:hypothetical protein